MKVDGDTSTNDCVIAMASGLSGLPDIFTHDSAEAQQLQACLDAVSFTSPYFSLSRP
jgi:glutamate N-acetyltransferase/amino-acid N-acetyltransferase